MSPALRSTLGYSLGTGGDSIGPRKCRFVAGLRRNRLLNNDLRFHPDADSIPAASTIEPESLQGFGGALLEVPGTTSSVLRLSGLARVRKRVLRNQFASAHRAASLGFPQAEYRSTRSVTTLPVSACSDPTVSTSVR